MPSACTSPKPVHAVMVLLTVVFLWFAMKRDPLPAREAFQLARGEVNQAYIPGNKQYTPESRMPGLQHTAYLRRRNRKNGKSVDTTLVQEWVRKQLEGCAQIKDCRYVFFTMSGKGKSSQYEARQYDDTARFVESVFNEHTLYEKDSWINTGPVESPSYWWIDKLGELSSSSGAPTAEMFKMVTGVLNDSKVSLLERNEALKVAAVLLLQSISVITEPEMVYDGTWTRRTFVRGFVKSLIHRFEERKLAFPIAYLIMAMREYASPIPNTVPMDDEALNRVPNVSALFPAALYFAALRLRKTFDLDDLTDALTHAGVDTARVLFGVGDPQVKVFSVMDYQQMMDQKYPGRMSLSEALKNAMSIVNTSSDQRPYQQAINQQIISNDAGEKPIGEVFNEASNAFGKAVSTFSDSLTDPQQLYPYKQNSVMPGFFK
jgi:hypothetical protein